MVLEPAATSRPTAASPAPAPFSSMIGEPAKPSCELPWIPTGAVIVGRADVGAIVCGPDAIAKRIVSTPGAAFAWVIASRSEHWTLQTPSFVSAVVLTVYTSPSA